MNVAEIARNAHNALTVFAESRPGIWFPETIQREIDYWRFGLAQALKNTGVYTIHEAYAEVPKELHDLIDWCADIAGSRAAA